VVVSFSRLNIPLHTIQIIKLAAATHISIVEKIQTLILSKNQPTTMTIMLSKTAANPIFEKSAPNLHIGYNNFFKNID